MTAGREATGRCPVFTDGVHVSDGVNPCTCGYPAPGRQTTRLDDLMASLLDKDLPGFVKTHRMLLATDRDRYESQREMTEALEAEARKRGLDV